MYSHQCELLDVVKLLSVGSWRGDCRRVFTFGGVVHEEALEKLMLDGNLLCGVVGQDVFMAHIVQTWKTETQTRSCVSAIIHVQKSVNRWLSFTSLHYRSVMYLNSEDPDQSVDSCIPGMAYKALLSSWFARNVTASVWDLWDCWTQTNTRKTKPQSHFSSLQRMTRRDECQAQIYDITSGKT